MPVVGFTEPSDMFGASFTVLTYTRFVVTVAIVVYLDFSHITIS